MSFPPPPRQQNGGIEDSREHCPRNEHGSPSSNPFHPFHPSLDPCQSETVLAENLQWTVLFHQQNVVENPFLNLSRENTSNFGDRLDSPNCDLRMTISKHGYLRKKLEHEGPEDENTGTFCVPLGHNSNILTETRCFQTNLTRTAPLGKV